MTTTASSRDLLKKLYQQLFPKSVRHDLGEYYTPDWLAEHVLNELEYVGDPDKRLLDPACGSGTFLVMAINRIRKWYDENRERARFDEGDLCRKILSNVVGFDLNPLAVMAARTNYLIAIRDLVGHVDNVEIPIYLCDSIMTPSEHGGLFAGALGKAKELKTAAAKFIIPTEIATQRDEVAKYAEQLEFGVRNGYSAEEFVQRCRDEGLSVSEEDLHTDLYAELVRLDKENKNGVWARIIKNSFAPIFVGKVDYVAGNPPWINWESLPGDYRQATAPLWQKYDLFRHKGYKAKLGGGKDDISILFTYVAHDCYLDEGGRLGFVITQSVFKTKGGGEGFRTLEYKTDRHRYYLPPLSVHDFSSLQPFEGATNRTAVIVVGKSTAPFTYPVPFVIWRKIVGAEITQNDSFDEVVAKTTRRLLCAKPVDAANVTSPWLTTPVEVTEALAKVTGKGTYTARKGVYCATNAIYWLTQNREINETTVLITNLADSGKRKVQLVTQGVEKAFVHPLVRGRDVSRWQWRSQFSIILPQHPSSPSKAVSESELKKTFPKTFAYFKQFEKDIRACALLKQFFDPTRDPFYSSYNVGEYTFQPFKVVWKEICPEIEAAVIEGTDETIIPDHKLVMVGFATPDPAYFLCAVLNSSPIRLFVRAYAISSSISGHIMEYARVPTFSPTNRIHKELCALAKQCHVHRSTGDNEALDAAEAKIDSLLEMVWGLTDEEMEAIRDELHDSGTSSGTD